jgi:hypothetical protein
MFEICYNLGKNPIFSYNSMESGKEAEVKLLLFLEVEYFSMLCSSKTFCKIIAPNDMDG